MVAGDLLFRSGFELIDKMGRNRDRSHSAFLAEELGPSLRWDDDLRLDWLRFLFRLS